ncbi:MAG: terminase TerL endonuclease subunit [Pseudomonadota bacterium]
MTRKKQRRTTTLFEHKDPTTEYAKRVVKGDIVAGVFVRASCQRHLDDLRRKDGVVWDLAAANDAINFFPAMFTVTAGAKVGEPFVLLDWMVFVVGSLFGWRRKDDRTRRFRKAWIEIGKGQAKSPLMGAIGVYITHFSGINRAEAYAIANDRDQAKILFSDAVALCRAPIPGKGGATLESLGHSIIRGVGDNAWKIEHPASGSKFLPVASSDAISGPKPIYVACDEIHEMKTDKAIQLWQAAIDKMSGDPLMVLGTNTPAIDQQVGTDYSEFYQRVATGLIEDDTAFSFIARVDDSDDPFNDESCWIKALPALGVTYPIENVRKRVQSSKHMASERLATERLFFGRPVGSSGFWIDEDKWRASLGEIGDVSGQKCFLALDLSQKNDLTALSACFRDESDRLSVKTKYWTTAEGIERRTAEDRVPYRAFETQGYLNIHDKEVIDYTFVAQEVAEFCAAHDVDSLTVDPALLSQFIGACENIGFAVWRYKGPTEAPGTGLKIVTHAQGARIAFEDRQLCMPHSIGRLSDKILAGDIVIEDNKLTTVCASNTILTMDGTGNQAFDKKRSRGRIDGMVSIAMAVGASKQEKTVARSYLATSGVRFT